MIEPMHRTLDPDPEFKPVTYGEVWVRVFDSIDGDLNGEQTWRHFHVSPPQGQEMSVEDAIASVEMLNAGEQHHAHRFEYYAVEVHVQRSMAEHQIDTHED